MSLQKNTNEEIRNLLVQVIESFENLTGRVIVENMSDVRPTSGVYATLWWKSSEPLVQNEGEFYENEEDEYTQLLDNETHETVQITIFGDNAYAIASRLQNWISSSNRNFDLWRKIGYSGVETVQDISTPYRGKIQQRAFFNFSFYVNYGTEYSAEYFTKDNTIVDGK